MCVYIYIYIYRERERERDQVMHVKLCACEHVMYDVRREYDTVSMTCVCVYHTPHDKCMLLV